MSKTTRRLLDDLQASAPDVPLGLSRAGVTGVQKAVQIGRGAREKLIAATIDCTVDLDPSQKGVHMSRFPELFEEAVEGVVAEDVAPDPLGGAGPAPRPHQGQHLTLRHGPEEPFDQCRPQEAGGTGDSDTPAGQCLGDHRQEGDAEGCIQPFLPFRTAETARQPDDRAALR